MYPQIRHATQTDTERIITIAHQYRVELGYVHPRARREHISNGTVHVCDHNPLTTRAPQQQISTGDTTMILRYNPKDKEFYYNGKPASPTLIREEYAAAAINRLQGAALWDDEETAAELEAHGLDLPSAGVL